MSDIFNSLISIERKFDRKSAGAYLVSTSSGAFPIFLSIADYNSWGMENIDDKYIVLPGYKIVVYTEVGYAGLSSTFDNTTGNSVKVYSLEDTGSIQLYINRGASCELYFQGNHIIS